MGTIKDFFEMTRHERRGAIMVLVIIAALLVATFAVRNCHETVPPVTSVDIRQFEAEADSSNLIPPATPPKPEKSVTPKKKRRHATPKSPKPAPAPRRLDPVPQI